MTRTLIFDNKVGYCWYNPADFVARTSSKEEAKAQARAVVEAQLLERFGPNVEWFHNPKMKIGFLDAITKAWRHAEVIHTEDPRFSDLLSSDKWSLAIHKDSEIHFWRIFDEEGKIIKIPLRMKSGGNVQTFGKRVGRLFRFVKRWTTTDGIRVTVLPGKTPVLNGLIVGGPDISKKFGLKSGNGSLTYFDGKTGMYLKGHFMEVPDIPANILVTSEDNVKDDILPCDGVSYFSIEEVHGSEHVYLDIQTAVNLLAEDVITPELFQEWTEKGLAQINKILANPELLKEFIPSLLEDPDLDLDMMEKWRLMAFLNSGVSHLNFRTLYRDVIRIVRRRFIKDDGSFARILIPGAKAGYMRPLLYFEKGTIYVADFSGYVADANCVYFGASNMKKFQDAVGGGDLDDRMNHVEVTSYVVWRNPNDTGEYLSLPLTKIEDINKFIPVSSTLSKVEVKQPVSPSPLDRSFETLRNAIVGGRTYEAMLSESWHKFVRQGANIGVAANIGMFRAMLKYDAAHGVPGTKRLLQALEAAKPNLETIIDLVQKGFGEGADEALRKLRKSQEILRSCKIHRTLANRFADLAEANGVLKNSKADEVFDAVTKKIHDFFKRQEEEILPAIKPPVEWGAWIPEEPNNGLMSIYFDYNRAIGKLLDAGKNSAEEIITLQQGFMDDISAEMASFADTAIAQQWLRKGIISILGHLLRNGGADSFIFMKGIWPETLDILREFGIAVEPEVVDESILLPSTENRFIDAIFGVKKDFKVVKKFDNGKVLIHHKGSSKHTNTEAVGRFRAFMPENREYTVIPGANQALIEAGKVLIGDDEFIVGDNQTTPADGFYHVVVTPYKLKTGKISKSSVWVTIVTKG